MLEWDGVIWSASDTFRSNLELNLNDFGIVEVIKRAMVPNKVGSSGATHAQRNMHATPTQKTTSRNRPNMRPGSGTGLRGVAAGLCILCHSVVEAKFLYNFYSRYFTVPGTGYCSI